MVKQKVIKIIRSSLAGAEDNLYRAKRMFDARTMDLSAEYGQSGQSCKSILDGYQKEYDELKAALDWVNKQG